MNVGFRFASSLDPSFLPLYRRIFPEKNVSQSTLDRIENEPAGVIFAEVTNAVEPVAFLYYWDVAGEFQIIDWGVLPELRRQGIGESLLKHFLTLAARMQRKSTLEVRAGNAAAIALYVKCGFKQVGQRRRYYSDGEDAILFER